MTCVQTQTCVNLQPDSIMANFDPKKISRTKATASGFALPNGTTYSRGNSGFSLSQTEPIQGHNSGPFWNESSEGQQNFHQNSSSHGHFPNGFEPFHSLQDNHTGQVNGTGSYPGPAQNQWNTELSATHIESQEMSRLPSQESQRTNHSSATNSYDQIRSTRMYPTLSQMSFHMSSARSDVTGRSNSPDSTAMYTPTQQVDIKAFDNFPYPAGEEIHGANDMFHRNSSSGISNPMDLSLTSRPSYSMYSAAGEETFVSLPHQDPASRDSMIYNPAVIGSPTLWDNGIDFQDSRMSSPVLIEDSAWMLPPAPLMTSRTNSPLDYSPSLEGLSPRYVEDFSDLVDLAPYTTGNRATRKPIGPRQSKVQSDLASIRHNRAAGTSETSDESFKLVGRSALELDNTARDHPLYHNAAPQADGLYHCPFEGKDNCQHRPEKLKCNYDKFVDSHLKPYKCKVASCESLQFSSTACLLRHEREAHAMHGHGEKPFLCTYEGCDRGVPGNGFPRHWNLRDHMRRVHNDPGQAKSNASATGSPPPSAPTRGKKRKAGDRPDSPSVEKTEQKAAKRVATPVIREPSLIEQYQQMEQRLLDAVKQLHDPKHPDNMDLLRNASHCIKVMAQTTQRINAAPAVGQNLIQTSG